jgi:hypothetical protein
MSVRRSRASLAYPVLALAMFTSVAPASAFAQDSSSAGSRAHGSQKARPSESPLDAGSVSAGVYRNATFGFTCKIPAGWVLRTEEMNAGDEEGAASGKESRAALDRTAEGGCPHTSGCGRVLLAAFSRPPEARAEDINASILIAAESAAAYPGLKEAVQYFGPVTEIAKAQGFEIKEEPYEYVIGTKKLVRGDFQKDVGMRVMRQSTLVMLARGYAVSFTFIGGTEDDVEELVQGLCFGVAGKPLKSTNRR